MARSTDSAGFSKRPLSDLELCFKISNENSTDIICYTTTVAAKSPLQHDKVRQALLHLYRKLPHLRVRIWRDDAGQLWIGAMEEENVLLEFLDDSHDPEKVHIEQTRKQHAVETGPMWRVTVLPARRVIDAETTAADFTHQYYVMFGFHHAITDGHSTVRTLGYFLTFLNAVIKGEEIDDQEQLAEFVDDCNHVKWVAQVKQKLETDKSLRKQVENMIAEQAKIEPILFKAYPPAKEPQPQTETIWRELEEYKTQAFLERAKLEKITIHSAFNMLIHGEMVDLMLDAGFMQDTYQLVSSHDLNERRYWDHDGEKSFGVHILSHKFSLSVPRDILNNFWENARVFHCQFQKELHDELSIVMESEVRKANKTSEDFYKNPSPCTRYYFISNMGDITRFFKRNDGADHEHVRAIGLRRSTTIHPYASPCGFSIQTMNGKLTCSLDYNTRIASHALAEKLLNKVFQLLGILS